MKQCRTCELTKTDNDFNQSELKRKNSQCRLCLQKYTKEYNNKNKDIINLNNRTYYNHNRTSILQAKKNYHLNNRDKKLTYSKNYYKVNKSTINNKNSKYINCRRKTNINFRLRCNFSRAVNLALKAKKIYKINSMLTYLPYTIKDLKDHITKQFQPWMSWSNWGTYKIDRWNDNDQSTWTWQIDHIIPQSDLPYTSMEDDNFKKCWSLENLRPLSSKENNIKNKY